MHVDPANPNCVRIRVLARDRAMHTDLALLLDAELAKTWRERRCETLASLYNAQQREAQRDEARLAIWFVSALYVLFAAADAVLITDVIGYTIAVRILISLTYGIGIGIQISRGVRASFIEMQCAMGVVVGFAAWLLLTSLSEHTSNVLLYTSYGTVFMMVANLFYNLRFHVALLTSGSITLIFFVATAFVFDASYEFLVSTGSLYLLSFVLTLFINWKLNAERYRVFLNSLSAEIRQRQARERGDQLLKLSTTDALTGLANRRATDDFLQELWRESKSKSAQFAVILIDIDYFKVYNDFYGHQKGDSCLVTVAHAMEGVVARHHGKIGRFGGEEFIVLLTAESLDAVVEVAEEIRRTVQDLQIEHEARSDHISVLTVSVGAAFSADVEGNKAERLVTNADRALYFAKDSNRNCVKMFDHRLSANSETTDSIKELLRTAIADNRLSLAYQPIWDVKSGTMLAAEALMRLTAADGSQISPAIFIPIAERTGAIVELGDRVIREACDQLMRNDAIPAISVNVSVVQLSRPNFGEHVADILLEKGVSPSRLIIEITEGSEIDENAAVIQAINELTAFGVRVWLDDFGTGFAGLSCLSKIAFDTVKIDRLFVQASNTRRGEKLLNDMMTLIANSGQNLILEGVETSDQVDRLKQQGARFLQGYYFNRPMTGEALDLLARKGTRLATKPRAA
jgi:diguanylate cyclase (GGDEF)-like protein